MKKEMLLKLPWRAILAEYLYERAPIEDGVPEMEPFRQAATKYLRQHPRSIPEAVDTAVSEWEDRDVPLENVLEHLDPPLLKWARRGGMVLYDREAPLYPTYRR